MDDVCQHGDAQRPGERVELREVDREHRDIPREPKQADRDAEQPGPGARRARRRGARLAVEPQTPHGARRDDRSPGQRQHLARRDGQARAQQHGHQRHAGEAEQYRDTEDPPQRMRRGIVHRDQPERRHARPEDDLHLELEEPPAYGHPEQRDGELVVEVPRVEPGLDRHVGDDSNDRGIDRIEDQLGRCRASHIGVDGEGTAPRARGQPEQQHEEEAARHRGGDQPHLLGKAALPVGLGDPLQRGLERAPSLRRGRPDLHGRVAQRREILAGAREVAACLAKAFPFRVRRRQRAERE